MTFINTIAEDEATEDVAALYNQGRETFGYLPNMFRAFSHRPQVMRAYFDLLGSIRSEMDSRRYELVTVAAARALRCSYCMLAHGSILRRDFYSPEDTIAIAKDFHSSELDAVDIDIMAFAEKVVRDATSITESDIDELRSHGLTDSEIFDIVTAAAVRCFYTKTLDALGARPDEAYNDIEEGLREALTVGRAIDGT